MKEEIPRAQAIAKPYHQCTRYAKCNVNNCPLHHDYPNMFVDAEDKEIKCTISKNYRYGIGHKYPKTLKLQGLTSREWVGKQRWDSLSEAEQEAIKCRAKQMADRLHGTINSKPI